MCVCKEAELKLLCLFVVMERMRKQRSAKRHDGTNKAYLVMPSSTFLCCWFLLRLHGKAKFGLFIL